MLAKFIHSRLVGTAVILISMPAFAVAPQDDTTRCGNADAPANYVRLARVETVEGGLDYKLYWNLSSSGVISSRFQSEVGGEFLVLRCLPPGRWTVVGRGQVETLNGDLVVASAERPAHSKFEEIQQGNMFARPMVGDIVVPHKVTVEPIARVLPRYEYSVDQLFERQDATTFTYNLSDQGKDFLRKSFEKYRDVSGRVVVESFVNKEGSRDLLQVESQIRAASVAQFLIREFGLEENRIAAVGLGSSLLVSGMKELPKWPAKEITEGIVLKVIPR